MGCFSFMCKKSGKPGNSSSFGGNPVHLFLLKKGKVIEHMFGNYDSYGRVFSSEKDPTDKSLTDKSSFEWKTEWGECCDLMFDNDRSNGIAVIHSDYWKEGDPYPTERSDDDPNQGWGDDDELLDSIDPDMGVEKVKEPYHKVYFDVSLPTSK